MGEFDPIPGWTRCPTCSSQIWRQWSEPELRSVLSEAVLTAGGLEPLAVKIGISSRQLQRFERRERVNERTVIKMVVYFQQQHHIAPMQVALWPGQVVSATFGRPR